MKQANGASGDLSIYGSAGDSRVSSPRDFRPCSNRTVFRDETLTIAHATRGLISAPALNRIVGLGVGSAVLRTTVAQTLHNSVGPCKCVQHWASRRAPTLLAAVPKGLTDRGSAAM